MSLLRPGLHLARRDERHLQLGLDPPWRVVVPDDPDVRRLLADLQAGRSPAPTTVAGHRAWRDLRAAGMLLDHDDGPVVTGAVSLRGTDRLVEAAVRLAADAALALDDADPGLVLLLCDGEPRRSLVDDLVHDGRTHLVLAGGPAGYRIGPLVQPGQTACLRCVDAHLAEHDPRRAVIVEQVGGRPSAPADPVLEALAVTWAVRDARHHLSGLRPVTWSATVELRSAPQLDLECGAESRAWLRHPHCGCSWAEALPG